MWNLFAKIESWNPFRSTGTFCYTQTISRSALLLISFLTPQAFQSLPYTTYDYMATGEFSLKISGAYQYEKICKDDKKGKVGEKLNFFIIAMIKRALQVKDDRTRRTMEEEIRRARVQKRWEMDSLIRKEREKHETLKKGCVAWHESQSLRAYIRAAYEAEPFDPESPFAKWLVWASLQADRMDPLKNSPPSVLDHDRPHW